MNAGLEAGIPGGMAPPPLAGGAALFLDIDGTLLDITEHPAAVVVDPALPADLLGLSQLLGGAVAVISGRSIGQVDALFAPAMLPVAGEHGSRRRDALGRIHEHAHQAPPAGTREALAEFARGHPGVLLEVKERSLALHFRRAPQCEEAVRGAMRSALAGLDGFTLLDGKMVLELKPAGADKGAAIARFLEEPPFAGRRPFFVGDDVGDEQGFAVVNAAGGVSIKVGRGQSVARYRLRDVGEVRAWLEAGMG